ncbi:MAG: hypothetical protein ACKVUS_21325 [Saprospiraceae bacterium]
MQAYRTHSIVQNGQVIVQLPEGFENTKVEVIVLKPAVTQPSAPAAKPKGKEKFSKYYGILKTGLTMEEIDTQLKVLREEWERPIS